MLEKIKAALKKAGIDESHAEKLASTITDESKIDSAVAELKKELFKSMTPEQLQEYAKANGFSDALIKMIQAESDRRVTEAIKTREDTLRKKGLLKDTVDDPAKKPDDDKNKDVNPQIVELMNLVKKQGEIIEQLAGAKKENDRKSLVKAALDKEKLPETLMANVTGDTEEQIAASVKALKESIQAVQQKKIDEVLTSHGIPLNSTGATTVSEDQAAALAKQANERDKKNAEGLKAFSVE